MNTITRKHQIIIRVLLEKGEMQSSNIFAEMEMIKEQISLVTVKRTLSEMVGLGLIIATGSGRSTNYHLTSKGRLNAEIDARQYVSVEPDKRYGLHNYNFGVLPALSSEIISDEELNIVNDATSVYTKRTADVPPAIQKKELERLVIELSWKSSKLEGNTYTLLDTEKLILENKEAFGHSKKETQMILNHKDAFSYIHRHSQQFKTVTRKNLEELHALVVNKLSVGLGLRTKQVGITGSTYLPLDNIHQITEAVEQLAAAVSRMTTPYAKALVALVGIGYIQPFEDGNKRTGRLMANALLLAHGCAPLSYRSVDENDYRDSMLVFYELNSIVPMKKIFIDQYIFAAQQYAVT